MGTEAAADRDSSSSAGVRVDTTESFGVKQAEITVNYRFSQRLGLKLLQKEVAERLGVEKTGIVNWECNRTIPEIQYMPAIIRFLGYNPLTKATGWGPWLVRQRTALV